MFCLKTLQIFGGNIMKYTKHVNLEKRKIHKCNTTNSRQRYRTNVKRKTSFFELFNIPCTWAKVQKDVYLYICTIYHSHTTTLSTLYIKTCST